MQRLPKSRHVFHALYTKKKNIYSKIILTSVTYKIHLAFEHYSRAYVFNLVSICI